MLVLFDHCTPLGIARYLIGHTVKPARLLGWAQLLNGALLTAAEDAGFEVMVSADKKWLRQSMRQRLAATAK